MKRPLLLWILWAVLFVSLQFTAAIAWQNNSAQERRDDQRVKDAQQALSKAKDKLGDVQKEANKAADHHRKMSTEQRNAEVAAGKEREAAMKRLQDSPQIKQAIGDEDKAKKEFERLADPILQATRATPEYKVLTDAAEKARRELGTVSNDRRLNPNQRATRLAELNREINAPNDAEKAAIAKDQPAAAAQRKWHDAQKKLTDLRNKDQGSLEKDWQFARALKTVHEANRDLAKAQSDLERHQQEIQKQQREVAAKQQNLNQAQQADRQNDNKNKNGNNKKR
jgi:hypothetical protein